MMKKCFTLILLFSLFSLQTYSFELPQFSLKGASTSCAAALSGICFIEAIKGYIKMYQAAEEIRSLPVANDPILGRLICKMPATTQREEQLEQAHEKLMEGSIEFWGNSIIATLLASLTYYFGKDTVRSHLPIILTAIASVEFSELIAPNAEA